MLCFNFLALVVALLAVSSGTPVENGDVVKDIKYFPYVVHVLITFKNLKTKKLSDFGCGGVILKAGVVLTAAHCVYDKKEIVNEIKVTAGSIYRKDEDSNMKTRFVSGFRVHKKYTPEKVSLWSSNLYLPFDIAMLWLKTPFTIKPNSKVQTAKMLLRDLPPNTIGVVVGWGQNENGDPSEVLKWTKLRKLSDEQCKKYYEDVGPHTFCAKSLDQKCGISPGDSGGPFIYNGIVIGITSFGTIRDKEIEGGKIRSICDQKRPVVFGDIRMYREWIGYSLDEEVPKAKCKKAQQKFCAL